MIAFLLIIALLPGAAWRILDLKGKKRVSQSAQGKRPAGFYLRVMFLFFCDNCFVASAVKWYSGSPASTLAESFWDMESRTLLHYGAVVIAVDIIVFAVLYGLLKSRQNKIVSTMTAVLFMLLFFTVYMCGNITNMAYCVIFVFGSALCVVQIFRNKTEAEYFSGKEYTTAVLEGIWGIGSWLVTVGVYLPNELYINNAGEFPVAYGEFFLTVLVGSLIIVALLTLAAVLLLPRRIYRLFMLAVTGISIMSYLQAMFLNGRLELLAGENQVWTIGRQLTNFGIWVIVVSAVIIGGYYKELVRKACRAGCIYIMLIQIATLGYLLTAKNIDNDDRQKVLTTEGALELANDENIIVFILDRFDSSDFDAMTEAGNDFLLPLSDFTYYANTSSRYSHTKTALPYILEGIEADGREASSGDGALMRMHRKGYEIGIYTNAEYISNDLRSITRNYNEGGKRSCRYGDTIKTMLRCSMYKTAPFVSKRFYRYSSVDIYEMAENGSIWNVYNDLPFYQALTADRLSVNANTAAAFRFYHMWGAHPPYNLSENMHYDKTGKEVSFDSQVRASLKIVYEYLEQMKGLGKYDSAVIIITADHGRPAEFDAGTGTVTQTSEPIMLVKQPYQHYEVMQVNNAPAAHSELMPTILQAAGLDWAEYGRTFDEIDENEKRTRRYTYDSGYKGDIIEYLIEGNVKDIGGWSIESIRSRGE